MQQNEIGLPHFNINKTKPKYIYIQPSKCTRDLDVSSETMKYLEETGRTLFHISFRKVFTDSNPVTRKTKAKVNQWHYFKLKNSAWQKESPL